MLKKRNGLQVFLFLLFAFSPMIYGGGTALAQEIEVQGQVVDANTNEELIGVNIVIKGTTRGTTSDLDGNFSLRAAENDTLVFSYVGYQVREVPLEGRTSLTVELMSEAIFGDEVVFVGYGVRRVEDNTGSIRTVSSENFNQAGRPSIGELFQGRIPGVEVTTSDGAPGSGSPIRIRGGSSLSASNDPLYVIDGVPVAPGGISGMRDPLNALNPNDIESVTVLKDASATAIYGSRASNGVIVITTKRGREGQPPSFSYSGKFSYKTQGETLEMLSTEQFRQTIEERFPNQTHLLGDHNTDWQDEIYSNVVSHEHDVSVSGHYADWNLPYHLSIGFSGDEGLLRTSSNDRLTGSLSLSPSFLDGDLRVDMNLRGARVENRFADQGALGAAVAMDPTQPVRVDDDRFGGYFAWLDGSDNPIPISTTNPVALLEQRRDESTVYRYSGKLQMDYTLPFMRQVTATVNAAFDYSDVGDGSVVVSDLAAFDFEGERRLSGNRTDYDQRRENQLLDIYLNYEEEFRNINSRLDATLGYSWQHNYEEGSSYTTNFNRADTLVVYSDTDYKTENYLVSFFGRVNYAFMDRYRLTATLRADGSSRFSEDNRWGYFPSMAFAWSLDQEPFMRGFNNLSDLRLRIGYGVTGQQEIFQGNYPYLARYTFSEPTAYYRFGNEFVQTLRPEGYNEELKWEETTTYNLALDYGFYNDRIRGSVEVYHRETKDLLNVIPVPAGSNFTNRIISNIGSLEVQGIEFDLTGALIATEDTYWEIGFNVSHNVNEITKLTTVDDPSYIGVETGGIAGGVGNNIQIHTVGHARNSFYVFEQVYDEDGNPVEGAYVDRNGDGRITDADKYRFESPDPDVTFGFSSRFRHRNWDASFSARAQIGNYVYNNIASEYGFYADMYYNGYLRNSPASVLETNFVNSRFHSDHYVENASFFRLDNVSVGYTFDNLFDLGTTMRLSGTVSNVFVITNYSGLDPEVFGGIDQVLFPRPRTFVMGVNINF
ncbi:SusC/RagA family TonB-linked outer membrane protein [Balneolales bacterium ANBcel1]|nr:SusC/RagA family TonB-linked outer membrane protein [Balneolales bacterium ANBcel1]